jgi:hypothetical protein
MGSVEVSGVMMVDKDELVHRLQGIQSMIAQKQSELQGNELEHKKLEMTLVSMKASMMELQKVLEMDISEVGNVTNESTDTAPDAVKQKGK